MSRTSEALRIDEPLMPGPGMPPSRLRRARSGLDDTNPLALLTPREREVALLLCWRWTNAEIAAHLSISPRTASQHVGNILGKLGAANRREAAAIAVLHKLG